MSLRNIARLIPSIGGILAFSGMNLSAEEAPQKAPIWELSDQDSTVYLAGSVHLLREKDMPIPRAFDAVYEQSDEMVFEIDMAVLFNPATAMKIREAGSLPKGETLSDRLSPELINDLRTYLGNQSLPKNLFDRFTPGMIYITLGSLEAVRNGAKPELGLEATFYQKTVKDGKPSRGLETAEYQMSLFNELGKETLAKLIALTLEEAEEANDSLDEIIAAWRSGDPEQIRELIVDQMSETPEVKEILLSERNRNWVPEIEKALAGKTNVMFLVGAAHLSGEDSVIDLLQKKGHHPTQVNAVE